MPLYIIFSRFIGLNKHLKTALRLTFFLGIGIFFIWIFLRNLTPEQKQEIWAAFHRANYFWIVLSILVCLASHFLRAVRWEMLLTPMGYKPKLKTTFLAVMIGYLSNLALPRLGEVSRCSVLARYEKVPFNKSFGTVIAERAIDMIVFIGLFFLVLVTQRARLYHYIDTRIYAPIEQKLHIDLTGSIMMLAIGGILLLGLLFIIFRKKIVKIKLVQKLWGILMGFWDGAKSITKLRHPLLFIFYSLAIWFLYILGPYLVFFSLSETAHLSFNAAFAATVFGSFGMMLVQGGIGVFPVLIAETLALYAIPETIGYAQGWLLWGAQTITILIFGIASIILLPILVKRRNHETT